MRLKTEWELLKQDIGAGKNLYIFGTGGQCEYFVSLYLEKDESVAGYFDNNRSGREYRKRIIKQKEELAQLDRNSVLLITSIYAHEILEEISALLPEDIEVYIFDGKILDSFNEELFFKLAKLLYDVSSQQILFDLRARGRGYPHIQSAGTSPWYFVDELLKPKKQGVYVDAGVLFGETIINYITWAKGDYKKIYAYEPCTYMYEKMQRPMCLGSYPDIVYRKAALWNENKKMRFKMDTRRNEWGASRLSEEGNEIVQCVALDNEDLETVTFIKMDIEGAEWEALHGAEKIIKRDKPDLAISLYHKPEDLYRIPFYIHEIVPDYKLYIRHHSMAMTEIVLYATV